VLSMSLCLVYKLLHFPDAGRVAPISACAFYQLHHFFVPLNGAC
jgi:hypothetical protein